MLQCGLTQLTVNAATPPEIGNYAFGYVPSTIPVYVPCASVSDYETNWSYFSNFRGVSTEVFDETICYGTTYTGHGFTNIDATGEYSRTEQTAGECEVAIILNLTVLPQINTEVTFNGATLSAAQADASYQWLDCNNGYAPITGATSQTFSPAGNGNYAVEITLNGCTAISECVALVATGIDEITANGIIIYPNPVEDYLQITIDNVQISEVQIFDVAGKIVNRTLSNGNSIDVRRLASGVYFVKAGNKTGRFVKK